MRLDKWLWFARFFRTRTLAAEVVGKGHVRVNAVRTTKAAHQVGPGDVLTFRQGQVTRVVRILELAERRGPAVEAQALYQEVQPNGA